jgi:hypothetical protein
MKFKFVLFIFVLFNNEFNTSAQTYCDFIKKVREYQNSVKLNEHWEKKCIIQEVDTSSFNINVYMNIFNKLTLNSGKVCLLVNNYNLDNGSPLLWVKDIEFNENKFVAEIIKRQKNFIDSIISKNKSKYKSENLPEEKISRMVNFYDNQKKAFTRNYALRVLASDSVNKACNNLIPDDSRDGYLQYLFFNQMGEQFALFWHSYYMEKTVICNKKDIEYYLNYYGKRKDSFEYSEKEINDLLHADLSPLVELDSNDCRITWYEIQTHRGIFKKTYSIERKYPFRVKNIYNETITTISANFFY